MSNYEVNIEFPVPELGEKACKFCHKSHPELHWDLGMKAYFHKECLEKHIEMEIKEALVKSRISFTDIYNNGGIQ